MADPLAWMDEPAPQKAGGPSPVPAQNSDPLAWMDSDPLAGLDDLPQREKASKDVLSVLLDSALSGMPTGVGTPENLGHIGDIASSLGSGTLNIIEGASYLPALGYETVSGKDAPEFLYKNKFIRTIDRAGEALNVKNKRYGGETLATLLDGVKRGERKPGEVVDYLTLSIAENAPQTLGIAAATKAGAPGLAVLGVAGAAAAGSKYEQLKKQNEDRAIQGLDPISRGKLVTSAWSSGGIEVLTEMLGTYSFTKETMSILKDFGVETAKDYMGRSLAQLWKGAKSEGLEEFFSSLGEDIVDSELRIAPTPTGQISSMKMFERAMEAGVIGSFLGGGLGGTHMAVDSVTDRPKRQEYAIGKMLGGPALSQLSDEKQAPIIAAVPQRYQEALKTRGLTPEEVRKLNSEERQRIIDALPEEMRQQFQSTMLNVKDLEQRLSKLRSKQGELPDYVIEDESLSKDPKLFNITDVKAQIEAEQAFNMPTEEYAKRREIIKKKLGIDLSGKDVPTLLRLELLKLPLETLESAPADGPNSLGARFEDKIYFHVGNVDANEFKFMAIRRMPGQGVDEGKLFYVAKTFQENTADPSNTVGPIQQFINDVLPGEDILREFEVQDLNPFRKKKFKTKLDELLKAERGRRAIKPAPSELVAQAALSPVEQVVKQEVAKLKQESGQAMNQVIQARASEQEVRDEAERVGRKIGGVSHMTDGFIEVAFVYLTRGHSEGGMALELFLEKTREYEERTGKDSAFSKMLHDPKAFDKMFDELHGKFKELTEKKQPPQGFKQVAKSAYDRLKEKLGKRGADIYSNLSQGKTPAVRHTKTREQFWDHYDEVRAFVGDLVARFGEKIKIDNKFGITISTKSGQFTPKIEINWKSKRDDSEAHRPATNRQRLEPQETPGIKIRVAAKTRVASSLAGSEIQIDIPMLRDDYKRLEKGELVESPNIEPFSPDTFKDFPNPEEVYIRYALLHEKIHLLAGINSEVLDENLVKLLALEIGLEAAEKAGIPTPRLAAEVQRLKDVMSAKIAGYKDIRWKIKDNVRYVVSWFNRAQQHQDEADKRIRGGKKSRRPLTAAEAEQASLERGSYKEPKKKKDDDAVEGNYQSPSQGFYTKTLTGKEIKQLIQDSAVDIVDVQEGVLPEDVQAKGSGVQEGLNDPNERRVSNDVLDYLAYKKTLDKKRGTGGGKKTKKRGSDSGQDDPDNIDLDQDTVGEEIDETPDQMFDEAQADNEAETAEEQAWLQSEEGQKVLKQNQDELRALSEGTAEFGLFGKIIAFLELYEQEKVKEGEAFQGSEAFNALAQWFQSEQGMDLLAQVKSGKFSPEQLMQALPDNLRNMVQAELRARRGDWKEDRALGYEVEPTPRVPRFSTKAPTKHASRLRETLNTAYKMILQPFGFIPYIFDIPSEKIKSTLRASGEEDANLVLEGMHPDLKKANLAQWVNAINDMLRRAKRDYQPLRSTGDFLSWHAGGDVTFQTIFSIIKNHPEHWEQLPNGIIKIDQMWLNQRLELMWKSLEEFRVPSLYAIDQPWRIVKTLVGKGLAGDDADFLENNKQALAGRTTRPDMFYFNQLTKEEKQAAIFANAEITKIRDLLLASGYHENTDMIANTQYGYFPAPSQIREEVSHTSKGAGVVSDQINSELRKKSTSADNFLNRGREQKLKLYPNAAVALSDYISKSLRALANATLANNIRQIPNQNAPLGWGVAMYPSDVVKWLKDNKWAAKKQPDGKTLYTPPAGSDKLLFPDQQYSLEGLMESFGYGEYKKWEAMKKDPGYGPGENPWMSKDLHSEFDWLFQSEMGSLSKIEEWISKGTYLSKLLIMYAPAFQLFQVGTAFFNSLITVAANPLESAGSLKAAFNGMVKAYKNNPSEMNPITGPFSGLGVKRAKFSTIVPHGSFENKWDMIHQGHKDGLSLASIDNWLQQIKDYADHEPWTNPKKTFYGQITNMLEYSTKFLFEGWLGNMSFILHEANVKSYLRKGFPESIARKMAADMTNIYMNMPGKYMYGKERGLWDALLFARSFSMSIARMVTGAFGLSGEGISTSFGLIKNPNNPLNKIPRRFLKSLFWGERTKQERRAMQGQHIRTLVTGMVSLVFLQNMINLVTTAMRSKEREPLLTSQNPEGKRDAIFLDYDEDGRPIYMRLASYQEFATILQFLSPEVQIGSGVLSYQGGRGPVEALQSRMGVIPRFMATVLANVDPTHKDKKWMGDLSEMGTDEWLDASYKLASITLPDYARENRDENKTLQEYIWTYLTGTQFTRGNRLTNLEGLVDIGGREANPGGLTDAISSYEFQRIYKNMLNKMSEERWQYINAPEKDIPDLQVKWLKNNPELWITSLITADLSRDQGYAGALKRQQIMSAMPKFTDEQRDRAVVTAEERGRKINSAQMIKSILRRAREEKEAKSK